MSDVAQTPATEEETEAPIDPRAVVSVENGTATPFSLPPVGEAGLPPFRDMNGATLHPGVNVVGAKAWARATKHHVVAQWIKMGSLRLVAPPKPEEVREVTFAEPAPEAPKPSKKKGSDR